MGAHPKRSKGGTPRPFVDILILDGCGSQLIEDAHLRGAVNDVRFDGQPISLVGRATEATSTVPVLSRE